MRSPEELGRYFTYWEITKDLIDQCIDIMLNLSQSGHPGGSRSKVHGMIITLLSGAMRWDIREAGKRFADRFILVAGHDNPMVYGTLAVLNEALRIKYRQTGEKKYLNLRGEEYQLTFEDLLTLRRNKGLPGHAEMEGKTLFFKFNTGPSGHGSPPAAGEALALKLAGVPEVKVFAFEGEGGLTTGATHETLNSAWGLGLDNLVYYVDWNDYGIDNRPYSSIVNGSPNTLFIQKGWHVESCDDNENWKKFTQAYYNLLVTNIHEYIPKMICAKSRKGRGYHIYDEKSHGVPHKRNSQLFWKTKLDFNKKYSVEFHDFGAPEANSLEGQLNQARSYFRTVFSVLESNQNLVDYLADTLVEIGESVPKNIASCNISISNPLKDKTIFDFHQYPKDLFLSPGEKAPNRIGFSKIASWLNTYSQENYGRPLFIAMSADLADSTNISGFAKGYGNAEDLGMFDRKSNPHSPLMPQGITEFTNAGMMSGLATVNFNIDTYKEYNGFIGAFSTYGSFSYLKYGIIRLFSQIAQDSQIKIGRLLWVVGHSGPETAEDSRTHFGIFAPGVTQLFPDGHIINLHPWEHNEVAPALASALQTKVPIIALHLTRPPIKIPDRDILGMASHYDASKGAYLIKNYDSGKQKEGTVIVRGTSATNSLVQILPRLKKEGPNVKVVAAISWGVFQRQSESYRNAIISTQEWQDAMVITNGALMLMEKWIANKLVGKYSISPDWDNRWRTGGSVEEIIAEAHLDQKSLHYSIIRFAKDRPKRLKILRESLPVY